MPMNFPTRPELSVEIAFIDTPLSGDVDNDAQIAVQTGSSASTGWTDITPYVRQVSIDRGRSDDLEKVSTGTATVLLDNTDRRFDPINQASPYWDNGSVVAYENLIKNPSFEYGIGNWFVSNGTAFRDTLYGIAGDYSLIATPSGANLSLFASNANSAAGTATTRTPVTPLEDYSFGIVMFSDFSGYTVNVGLRFYDDSNTLVLDSYNTVVTTVYDWIRLEETATAPANATGVVPYVIVTNTVSSPSPVCAFDAAILVADSSVQPFFDGDVPGCRWTGTPGNSTSKKFASPVNFFFDPSFEYGTAAGFGASSGSWGVTTEDAFAGNRSLRFEPLYSTPENVSSLAFRLLPGVQYKASVMIRPVNGSANMRLRIYTNNYATNTNTFQSSLVTLTADVWNELSFTFTPTVLTGDKEAALEIAKLSGSTATHYYIDAICISPTDLSQPYIDGDISNYEWFGEVGNSPSEQAFRSSQTLLKPRRQIQIHGVFPNNAINDQECYDLISGTTLSPGTGSVFTRFGLRQVSAATTFTNNGFLPSTDRIKVKTLFRPTETTWLGLDAAVWTIPNLLAMAIYNGRVQIWSYILGGWFAVFDEVLPSVITTSRDAFWIEADIERAPFFVTDFRWKVNVGYTAAQTPVPEVFTAIGDEATGVATSPFPDLEADSVVFGGSTASFPSAVTGNNAFTMERFVIEDVTNDDRVCDLMANTYITIFRGYTTGWRQQYDMTGKDATVPLECFDGLGIVGSMQMPTDFVTQFVKEKEAWGYWKLGDAGGIAVDYSGNANDLLYNDGGRLPSTYGALASGLSGLPSTFKQDSSYSMMVTNASGADKYPVATGSAAGSYTVAFWARTSLDSTSSTKMPLFLMSDASSLGGSPTTKAFLEIGINPYGLSRVRTGTMYILVTNPLTGLSMMTDLGPLSLGTRFIYVDDQEPHHFCVVMRQVSPTMYVAVMYQDGVQLGIGGPYSSVGIGGVFTIGGRNDTTASLQQFTGDIQDVMFLPGTELNNDQVAELYDLSNGYIQESTKERANRLLDYSGFPEYLRAIDNDMYGNCGAIANEEGQTVLEAMNLVEDTEAGTLFVDRTGRLAMRGRYFLSMNDLGVTVQAAFDDANVGIGYTNLEFNLDADQLANDTTVLDDAEQENQSSDEMSVVAYGRRSRSIKTLLPSSEDAYQMAIGLTNIYKEPILRAEPFTIVPTFDQWLNVLPLDIGVRMSLEATPMGIGAPIQQELALQAISYDIRPKDWSVTIVGSPRPVISYFVLDRSELDGEDVLGF